MDSLYAARIQMGLSLAFHMVFAAAGIGMPLLMLIAEGLWLRTGKSHYRDLARMWGKATGLLFAVGAVSGTALSFELGLLWPRLMENVGSIVGPAFALEGFAFFIEAIFLGLYLYGWDRLSPFAHWLTGIPVAVSGLLSGILVVAVNAWMQTPVEFQEIGGRLAATDPLAAFHAPLWMPMAIHSSISCYVAMGFAAAGVYAWGMLRGRRTAYHRAGLAITMFVGTLTALIQPISGDLSGRMTARHQPLKLAAMEALFETRAEAPLVIGGIPDVENRKVYLGIDIPYGLSLLATHDPHAVIRGLNDFPIGEWPNVLLVHIAFQIMVSAGTAMMLLGLWYWLARWRGWATDGKWMLWALVLASPLGFIALEAGWMVTELGRQPWAVYGVLRTSQSVTPATDVPSTLLAFGALYVALGAALITLLLRLGKGKLPVDLEAEEKLLEPRDGA